MTNIPHFKPVRLTASSEEAAISQALMMTGATRDDVEVEILDKTEKGVTVRVSPRRAHAESAPEPASAASAAPAEVAPQAAEATAEIAAEATTEATTEANAEVSAEAAVEESGEESAEPDEAPGEESDASEAAPVAEAAPATVPSAVPAREAEPAQVERAQNLANEFLEKMGLVAQARPVPPPSATVEEIESAVPVIYLDIEGEDVGILIGKHGQTLQSFQYLLNLTLNNRVGEENEHEAVRVVVDAGGYRTRRAQSLEQTARSAAARAKRDHRPVRLDPMPAHERRLVHIALRGDNEISTGSEGREPHRYVVITPAGSNGGHGGRGGFNRGGGRGPRRNSFGGGFGGSRHR